MWLKINFTKGGRCWWLTYIVHLGPSQSILIGWSLCIWWYKCEGSLKQSFAKTIGTLTAYALALKNFTNFVESWSPFSNTTLMKDLNLLPYEWWDLIRANGRTFATITHRILAQVYSTSSYEQNWNSYYLFIAKCEIN
jgi:hypothetical protein